MKVFRLHVWREWREHRAALLTLACVLPLATGLLAWPLSRGTIGSLAFRGVVTLGFALVFLIAVGGELLGGERRGSGLRWLERLPSGLGGAFRAKLAFFVLGFAGSWALGYGVARLVAWLRNASPVSSPQDRMLVALLPLAAIFALWTFSASLWTLRGGLALLASALVLALVGFPIWRVVEAGYRPSVLEYGVLVTTLSLGAVLGAGFGFVHGARLGRALWISLAIGLAPAVLALAVHAGWSAMRSSEAARFDPLAADFRVMTRTVSEDGRVAFEFGMNVPPRWDERGLPLHALRVDLEHGTFEHLGLLVDEVRRYGVDGGLPYHAEQIVTVEGREQPLVFEMVHGEPRPWTPRGRTPDYGYRVGLGIRSYDSATRRRIIHDSTRGRDFDEREVAPFLRGGSTLVRPGRWLFKPSAQASWQWFDPETGAVAPTEWPVGSEPLVLLEDGGVVLAHSSAGLEVVHPELGTVRALDSQGIAARLILPNEDGLRVPGEAHGDDPLRGTIVLRTRARAWLVLDESATSVRRLDVDWGIHLVQRSGPDEVLVEDWNRGRAALSRFDLRTGALTRLWPREDGSP